MNEAAEILVIITSSVLILFLLLAIILLTQFIFLIRRIKKLIHKAENMADAVEAIGETLSKASFSAGLANVVGSFIGSLSKAKNKRGK